MRCPAGQICRLTTAASGGSRIGRKGGSASKFADADSKPPFGTPTETGRLLTRDGERRYDREATVAGNDPPGHRSRPAPYLPKAAEGVARALIAAGAGRPRPPQAPASAPGTPYPQPGRIDKAEEAQRRSYRAIARHARPDSIKCAPHGSSRGRLRALRWTRALRSYRTDPTQGWRIGLR